MSCDRSKAPYYRIIMSCDRNVILCDRTMMTCEKTMMSCNRTVMSLRAHLPRRETRMCCTECIQSFSSGCLTKPAAPQGDKDVLHRVQSILQPLLLRRGKDSLQRDGAFPSSCACVGSDNDNRGHHAKSACVCVHGRGKDFLTEEGVMPAYVPAALDITPDLFLCLCARKGRLLYKNSVSLENYVPCHQGATSSSEVLYSHYILSRSPLVSYRVAALL